ncbi:CHAD domain-containing protein [Streptomyces althioticus]|uniref:CHAD domain-containing protein n=1 Tax=Streptomyces althioticus TaxID=83380 RepID=UPI003678ED1B
MDVLARHLRARATEFLRALRLHRDAATPEDSAEAARALGRAARRIGAGLYTFRPALDPSWSRALGPELAWVSGTLSQEDACATRLTRLLEALHHLSGAVDPPASSARPAGRRTPAPAAAATSRPPSPTVTPPATDPAHTPPPATDHPSSAPGAEAPATRPEPRSAGAPTPDVPRPAPADGVRSPARAVRAAGSRPVAARLTPASTVTATVPAPAGRRPEREPGGAGGRRAEGDLRAPGHTGSGVRTAGPRRDSPPLAAGAARAAALLERQLTLARTRAHSAALRALGSARFHAVADQVAVLAGEVPLAGEAGHIDLRPLADAARERLEDAVAALPLLTAGSPYNAEALVHGLSPDPSPHPQDAPWHQVRLLLRLHRYAQEVLDPAAGDDPRLRAAGEALDRHRDAAEAAAAAAQAGRTPRIAPATAYALGVLHAGQRHEVEAARYAFQRAWQQPPAGTP